MPLHLATPRHAFAAVTHLLSFSGISVELIMLGVVSALMAAYGFAFGSAQRVNALIVVLGQFPGNSRIRVVQIAVEAGAAGAVVHAGRIGLAVPLGTFYNRVMQVGPTGTYPNIERYNLPVQCQQCTHARCVEVCPTGASYRDSESGIVLVNEAKCIGCRAMRFTLHWRQPPLMVLVEWS